MRGVLAAVAGAALASAGWALAGPAGLLGAGAVAASAALLLVRISRVPGEPRPPARERPGVPQANAPYRRYRQLASALSWGRVSARHFDGSTRPELERIAAARLLERRGIDPARDPAAARELLGAELWELVDPGHVRSTDSRGRPPAMGDVARLVRRLEEL